MVSTRRRLYCLCVATALCIVFGAVAIAQQVFGSIIGTVTDPSGSAVANAQITITDVSKGTSSVVTTNSSGQYLLTNITPNSGHNYIYSDSVYKSVSDSFTAPAGITVHNVALNPH